MGRQTLLRRLCSFTSVLELQGRHDVQKNDTGPVLPGEVQGMMKGPFACGRKIYWHQNASQTSVPGLLFLHLLRFRHATVCARSSEVSERQLRHARHFLRTNWARIVVTSIRCADRIGQSFASLNWFPNCPHAEQ